MVFGVVFEHGIPVELFLATHRQLFFRQNKHAAVSYERDRYPCFSCVLRAGDVVPMTFGAWITVNHSGGATFYLFMLYPLVLR